MANETDTFIDEQIDAALSRLKQAQDRIDAGGALPLNAYQLTAICQLNTSAIVHLTAVVRRLAA